MRYAVISFDLQGTLSDESFSNVFWCDLLPELYAENQAMNLNDAKQFFVNAFQEIGRYDQRYYSVEYWLNFLKLDTQRVDIFSRMPIQPTFFPEMKELLIQLHQRCPLNLYSATTREFIYHELGEMKSVFSWIFSAIDDLKVAGKTTSTYSMIASSINVPPEEILHIGDDSEMDIHNAHDAGWDTLFFDKRKTIQENIEQIWKKISS